MVNLSKSKYCGLWQCPKMAWLRKYKPGEAAPDAGTDERMAEGNVVGDLAMQLFGDYTEVTEYTEDTVDVVKMTERTKAEMAKGTAVICEASFIYEGLYCAVDLLKKTDDGWALYEVKSSSKHKKDGPKAVYIADIAYQKYVLENCGVTVTGTYLVQINPDYVRSSELDIQQLFVITDVSGAVNEELNNVAPNIALAEKILGSEEEPGFPLSVKCRDPYACAFWDYCTKDLPSPSVFNIYRMNFSRMISLYEKGITGYRDVIDNVKLKSDIQKRQIDFELNEKSTYTDKTQIREFLAKLSYPLYFLDFETMQPVIPPFEGTHPFQQIPFQYSLHYIEYESGELKHREFLAESGTDPRRMIAEQLCADIPENVCVTAYNKSFECGRIKELAELYPDLAAHLQNIGGHIVDLLEPFSKGMYYKREMGGSFSIKSVLPALCPDDPELDYHSLDGVHNGSEAMAVFPKIRDMSPEDRAAARRNLLKYCELDTLAMVKVWEKLKEAAQ